MTKTKERQATYEQYEREDLDPNQELDWTDVNQKYCGKHDRTYHLKCRGCYPI